MTIKNLAAHLAIGLIWYAEAASASEPAYRLSAGREFTYHNEARCDRKSGEVTYLVDWKVWAIGQEPDGAWKLVIRCGLTTKTAGKADKPEADTLVWRCKMYEDGRLVGATAMGTVRDPFRLFPRLPNNPEEKERGWNSSGPDAAVQHHRLTSKLDSEESTLAICTKTESPEDKVYLTSHEYRATFDTRRGVVTRVETEDQSGYGITGVTKGTIELTAIEDRGSEWAVTFGRESNRYFDAVDAYDRAVEQASRDFVRGNETLVHAKQALEAVRKDVKTQAFIDAMDLKLSQHDRTVKYSLEQAKTRAERLGKPAADWEAQDLDGKVHRLADYRGKVVVMDFWYRGCGWCMHAMPQVNRLSKTFLDEPVAVLGMTIDKDEKDARVVVDAMDLAYPAIKAEGIPEKYEVSAYPTLIVVDKAGKVREIHVGYSPHLYEDLSALIKTLLAEKPRL